MFSKVVCSVLAASSLAVCSLSEGMLRSVRRRETEVDLATRWDSKHVHVQRCRN